MRSLVSGGAGFIGSHLVEALLDLGHEVLVIDNLAGGRLSNLQSIANHSNFTFVEADIRDLNSIQSHFDGCDWVFHLAGLADIVPSIENPSDYFTVNVDGTFNMLEASRQAKVKRFVYAASSSCYGIPDNYPTPESAEIRPQYPYALSKRLGEELVLHWAQVYGMQANALRLFNVYGPRVRTTGTYGAVFGVFMAQKLNQQPYTVVGDGEQSRDFTFVTDVAQAFIAMAQSELSGETLNVGSGHHFTINHLVDLLGGKKVYIPKRPGEPDITFADTRLIHEKLNWLPQVDFKAGVQQMLNSINDWKDAPLWEPKSIEQATQAWFEYLG